MCLVGWLDTKIEVDQRILELGQFSLCWEVSTFIGREIFGFKVLCRLPSSIAISAVEVPFFFFFFSSDTDQKSVHPSPLCPSPRLSALLNTDPKVLVMQVSSPLLVLFL